MLITKYKPTVLRDCLMALGCLTLGAAAHPARAIPIDYVTTHAGNVGASSPSITYDSNSGLTTTACPAGLSCASTSTTSALNATSSTVTMSATAVPGGALYLSGSSSANSATGALGVTATGSNFVNGYDMAQLQDFVTFNNTTGTTQLVTLSFAVNGTASGTRKVYVAELCLLAGASFGQCNGGVAGSGDFYYSNDNFGGVTSQTPSTGGPLGWQTASISPGGSTYAGQLLSGTYRIPTGSSSDDFLVNLYALCGASTGGTCTYNGALSLTTPIGVTFSSTSGVLLTSPVPLPPSLALLLSGVGLIGVLARRRVRLCA